VAVLLRYVPQLAGDAQAHGAVSSLLANSEFDRDDLDPDLDLGLDLQQRDLGVSEGGGRPNSRSTLSLKNVTVERASRAGTASSVRSTTRDSTASGCRSESAVSSHLSLV
jgi:hypothetical protein